MEQERGQFSSKVGFILAAAGSAVGLGNLVAFPVMASKNGGAAFLIIYLFFIALICYPVMMAEIAMGRNTTRNPVGAFSVLSGGSPAEALRICPFNISHAESTGLTSTYDPKRGHRINLSQDLRDSQATSKAFLVDPWLG
mgnify:CR=1 FL=1